MQKNSALKNKTIILGISGSIAIYKACELLRRLKECGADIHCLMTAGAQKFITPLTFSALSGHPVATSVWDESLWEMAHIKLAESAQLILIAPASADCISNLASGASDNVLTATVLAARCPILIAPAMHEGMWLNPATQSNIEKIKGFGMHLVGPEHGPLLGSTGWGRMADIPKIIDSAGALLAQPA